MKNITRILLLVLPLTVALGCETVTKATYFAPDGTGITFEKTTPLFVDSKIGSVSITTRPFGFNMTDYNQSVDPQLSAVTKSVVEGAIAGAAAAAKP